MHNRFVSVLSTCVVLALAGQAAAQVTMTPLATFGTNGWLAPGALPNLGTANNERGLAYNPQTGHLVLVSRTGGTNLRVLSGTTGADLGGLVTTGIAGGTFAVNMCEVGDDGFIYVGNLSTSATTNFTVYGYPSETAGLAAAPIVVFNGLAGVTRVGDAFDVIGNFPTATFCAAGSSTVSASNFVIGSLDQTNTVTSYLSVGGTTTVTNDYRLALTWVDSQTLIGAQGTYPARYTSIAGGVATVTASIPLGAASRRAMDYAVIGNTKLLATIDTVSSVVTLLDITDPLTPITLASATTTSGTLATNGNGTGAVAWGPIVGNTATLYAMSTNQGIQAFTVTLNPLGSTTIYGAGCDNLTLLAPTGAPFVGNAAFSLEVSNVPFISPIAFVAFGAFAIDPGIDLTGIGMPGCSSYQSFDIGLFATGPVVAGVAPFVLPIPNNVSLAGATLAAQGVSLSLLTPANLAASNGVQLFLGY